MCDRCGIAVRSNSCLSGCLPLNAKLNSLLGEIRWVVPSISRSERERSVRIEGTTILFPPPRTAKRLPTPLTFNRCAETCRGGAGHAHAPGCTCLIKHLAETKSSSWLILLLVFLLSAGLFK